MKLIEQGECSRCRRVKVVKMERKGRGVQNTLCRACADLGFKENMFIEHGWQKQGFVEADAFAEAVVLGISIDLHT